MNGNYSAKLNNNQICLRIDLVDGLMVGNPDGALPNNSPPKFPRGALDRYLRDRIVSQSDAHELLAAHHPKRAEPDGHEIASLREFRLYMQLPGGFLRGGR